MLKQTLRNTIAIASLALPMTMSLVQPALAALQDFTVHNQTGRTMIGLWVSNSGSNRWGDNVLDRTLPDNYRTRIVFPNGASHCMFDLAAKFSDGSSAQDYQVNLCRVSQYTFYE
jgi:hypothetical protein